jgi:glycosyltransferase involved in cell wall biosynthesis
VPGRSGPVKFSHILAPHGRTEEPERFLSSLDAQTYSDFELIAVGQNPDERLRPFLKPYETRFGIQRLSSKKGLSRARNAGLESPSGDVVAFPDDDCHYPPDLLERVASFFSEHPEIDGICGRSVDESGKNSNMSFNPGSGSIDRFNVWRRAIAYTTFFALGAHPEDAVRRKAGSRGWHDVGGSRRDRLPPEGLGSRIFPLLRSKPPRRPSPAYGAI